VSVITAIERNVATERKSMAACNRPGWVGYIARPSWPRKEPPRKKKLSGHLGREKKRRAKRSRPPGQNRQAAWRCLEGDRRE
jgi:hypothetical protein